MDNAVPNLSSAGGQQQVWRAQFSSLAPVDLKRAMASLGSPNKDMSDSVDARAEAWCPRALTSVTALKPPALQQTQQLAISS